MKTVISSGHGKYVSGAVGILNEVAESRRVVSRVASLLKSAGIGVVEYHDETGRNQTANVNAIVSFHNSHQRDLDVSVHFNAHSKTDDPRGVEVLYHNDATLAAIVSAAIANASGLRNRGAKQRTDLGFLRNTSKHAILIEVCFVDSSADAAIYRVKFEDICQAITESVSGVKIERSDEAMQGRYNRLEDVPTWGKDTILKLINKGLLQGTGAGLNLTEDMVRILVINDRAGLYD